MNLMIKMINLINAIPFVTVMTDISAIGKHQCQWNSTSNKVTEKVYCPIFLRQRPIKNILTNRILDSNIYGLNFNDPIIFWMVFVRDLNLLCTNASI